MWKANKICLTWLLLSILIFSTESNSGLKLVEQKVQFLDVSKSDLLFANEEGKINVGKTTDLGQNGLTKIQNAGDVMWGKFGFGHQVAMKNIDGVLSFYKKNGQSYSPFQSIDVGAKTIFKMSQKFPLIAIVKTDLLSLELYNYVDNHFFKPVRLPGKISQLGLCENMIVGVGSMINVWEYNMNGEVQLVWKEEIKGGSWTISEDCERISWIQTKGRNKIVKVMQRKGMAYSPAGQYQFERYQNIQKVNLDEKGENLLVSGEKYLYFFKLNKISQKFEKIKTVPMNKYTVEKVYEGSVYITQGKDLYNYKFVKKQTKKNQGVFGNRNLQEGVPISFGMKHEIQVNGIEEMEDASQTIITMKLSGNFLIAGSQYENVYLYKNEEGKFALEQSFSENTRWISSADVDPEGQYVVISSKNKNLYIYKREGQTYTLFQTIETESPIMTIDYTDGDIFVGHFNGAVAVYRFNSEEFQRIWLNESPDGRTIYDGKMCADESFVFTMQMGGKFYKKVFRENGEGGFEEVQTFSYDNQFMSILFSMTEDCSTHVISTMNEQKIYVYRVDHEGIYHLFSEISCEYSLETISINNDGDIIMGSALSDKVNVVYKFDECTNTYELIKTITENSSDSVTAMDSKFIAEGNQIGQIRVSQYSWQTTGDCPVPGEFDSESFGHKQRITHQEFMRFKDSNKGITAIKMVGEQLLSCLDENRAHIYKKEDNGEYKLFFTFGDSEGKVTDGDISRIDKWVAIGSEDGHVYLYRGLGMLYEFIGKIEGEDTVLSVNFNILGHLIIGDSLGNIRIYHYNGQQYEFSQKISNPNEQILQNKLCNDNSIIALTKSSSSINIKSFTEGEDTYQQIQNFPIESGEWMEANFDCSMFAVGGDDVYIYNKAKTLFEFNQTIIVDKLSHHQVAMNYDGDLLVIADNHEAIMYRFDFCDSKYVEERSISTGQSIQSVAITDQQFSVGRLDGEVVVEQYSWDTIVSCRKTDFDIGPEQVIQVPENGNTVEISDDSQFLLFGNTVYVKQSESGEYQLHQTLQQCSYDQVHDASLTSDGEWLVLGCWDNHVYVYKLIDSSYILMQDILEVQWPVAGIHLTEDHERLIVGKKSGDKGLIQVYQFEKGYPFNILWSKEVQSPITGVRMCSELTMFIASSQSFVKAYHLVEDEFEELSTLQEETGKTAIDVTSDCSYILTALAQHEEEEGSIESGRNLQEEQTILNIFQRAEEQFSVFQTLVLDTVEATKPRITNDGSHIIIGDKEGTEVYEYDEEQNEYSHTASISNHENSTSPAAVAINDGHMVRVSEGEMEVMGFESSAPAPPAPEKNEPEPPPVDDPKPVPGGLGVGYIILISLGSLAIILIVAVVVIRARRKHSLESPQSETVPKESDNDIVEPVYD